MSWLCCKKGWPKSRLPHAVFFFVWPRFRNKGQGKGLDGAVLFWIPLSVTVVQNSLNVINPLFNPLGHFRELHNDHNGTENELAIQLACTMASVGLMVLSGSSANAAAGPNRAAPDAAALVEEANHSALMAGCEPIPSAN